MNIAPTQGERYPIIIYDSADIAIGTIVYRQTAIWGTPLGLLLSLTMTPQFTKCIKTDHGLRTIK